MLTCPNCGHEFADHRPILTKRQHQVLQYLRQYRTDFGYMPTLAEMAADLGLSAQSGVFEHLSFLEAKGYLRRTGPHGRRAIQLIG